MKQEQLEITEIKQVNVEAGILSMHMMEGIDGIRQYFNKLTMADGESCQSPVFIQRGDVIRDFDRVVRNHMILAGQSGE